MTEPALKSEELLEPALLPRLERLSLVSGKRRFGRGHGERRSFRRGSSLDFVDYRAYAPGDDPRRVDWNVYARSGHLFLKLFEQPEALSVHVLVDVSRSMDWGEPNKLRYALRLAGALGYVALCDTNLVTASALSSDLVARVGPVWGRAQARQLLEFLAGQRATGESDLRTAIQAHLRATTGGGLALVISDLLTSAAEAGLRSLVDRRLEVRVFHVLAPQELRPELGGDVNLVDRETGRRVALTLNQDASDAYQTRLAQWLGQIESFCRRQGILYHRLETSEPLEQTLFVSLRRRGVLA